MSRLIAAIALLGCTVILARSPKLPKADQARLLDALAKACTTIDLRQRILQTLTAMR